MSLILLVPTGFFLADLFICYPPMASVDGAGKLGKIKLSERGNPGQQLSSQELVPALTD